ncbi:MAG: hypothetical protein AAFR61_27380 [Bacteroidota bacterium]
MRGILLFCLACALSLGSCKKASLPHSCGPEVIFKGELCNTALMSVELPDGTLASIVKWNGFRPEFDSHWDEIKVGTKFWLDWAEATEPFDPPINLLRLCQVADPKTLPIEVNCMSFKAEDY